MIVMGLFWQKDEEGLASLNACFILRFCCCDSVRYLFTLIRVIIINNRCVVFGQRYVPSNKFRLIFQNTIEAGEGNPLHGSNDP
jgi:hypothetical protein